MASIDTSLSLDSRYFLSDGKTFSKPKGTASSGFGSYINIAYAGPVTFSTIASSSPKALNVNFKESQSPNAK